MSGTPLRRRLEDLLEYRPVRFLISGGTVFVISFSLTAGLHALGAPFQVGFLIAYAIAVTVHLQLHRRFTFGGEGDFALAHRAQAVRFLLVVVGQYAFIALAVAIFAPLLDLPQIVVYLLAIAVLSVANYITLAARVFHRHDEADQRSSRISR